jgi:formylglycine-generating enzyme required for sulfatase activity
VVPVYADGPLLPEKQPYGLAGLVAIDVSKLGFARAAEEILRARASPATEATSPVSRPRRSARPAAMAIGVVLALVAAAGVRSLVSGADSASQLRPRMLEVPAGEFWMGSPENEPGRRDDEFRHRVRISRPFLLP